MATVRQVVTKIREVDSAASVLEDLLSQRTTLQGNKAVVDARLADVINEFTAQKVVVDALILELKALL